MSPPTRTLSGWHPEDVKAAVRKKGVTLTELGLRNGFSEAYLRNALYRPRFAGEQIIAKFLGVDAKEIWPDRYDDQGNPNYRNWTNERKAEFWSRQRRRSAA